MDTQNTLESHHGLLMNIAGNGVLFIGPPAIGKSSLAIELLSQGHQLIADDVIDFYQHNNTIYGQCPAMLAGLVHSRELGLISVPTVFGESAWQKQHQLDYIIELSHHHDSDITFSPNKKEYIVLNQSIPLLRLSLSNPATLSNRINCWLKMQVHQVNTENELIRRQQKQMELLK